ncbi:unnamed protein product [Alopecurus aequalis]
MEALQWIISVGTSFFEAIQLSNDLSRLRGSLPKAHILINRAEWGRFKDKNLALLLSHLKDTTSDAEDLLREFVDQELRQKMEDTGRNRAGQLVSSSYNLAKSFLSGSKTRLKEAQSKLDMVVSDTEAALNLMGLNVEPAQLGKPLMPETSSVIGVPQVYGRNEERDLVMERLGVTIGRDNERDHAIMLLGVPLTRYPKVAGKKGAAIGLGAVASTSRAAKRLKGNRSRGVSTETSNCCTGNVFVLPIVGIGGVGKTTLAQFIYNDTRVKSHFDVRLWVCVSDIFDKRRITKEIMESLTGEEFMSSGSLDALHVDLKEKLMSEKFLLVLDDVWPIANNEWEAFFAPFRLGVDGSMVLLTTRFPKVANLVSTVKPIELEGLPSDIFWEFFKKCAFGKNEPELYPRLQDIGRSIAHKLCGSPLAAKTLGRLLSMELTQQHWRTIQSSELWELPYQENEILPALQLSYLYLPQKLKRCFAVCSIFPKDYSFERDELVTFWVAQCFVESEGTMRLEDIGCWYLDDLRSRFLFQTDPMFPNGGRYVMHDLIHDMAQSVAADECFRMQDLSDMNLERILQRVRHMTIKEDTSIGVNNEALSRMGGLPHFNKLHSLRFEMRFETEAPWFKHLSNILFLSLKGCKMVKLPKSISQLNSLRCLDISQSNIKELPEKLWCLHSLQYFYANGSGLEAIPQDVTKLVNLRRLALPEKAAKELSKKCGLGKLLSLQNLMMFTVGSESGCRIGELKNMNQLSGGLRILWLFSVGSMQEASEARLVDKQYLKLLILEWRHGRCVLRTEHNEVLEGLHPPSGIEHLEIEKFGGDCFPPSWFTQENLPALTSLHLTYCDGFESFIIQRATPDTEALTNSADDALGGSSDAYSTQQASIDSINSNACLPFISLTNLYLFSCRKLTNLDQCLTPEYFPSIQSIQLLFCGSLESLPVHKFGGFVCLRDLEIMMCSSLMCQREMVLPYSIQRLYIKDSGNFDGSLKPDCLENLPSLTLLYLQGCSTVESILLNSINTNNLCLVLKGCPELSSIGGSHALSSIKHVDISGCPKLSEVQEQPLVKKGLKRSELSELQNITNHKKRSQHMYNLD